MVEALAVKPGNDTRPGIAARQENKKSAEEVKSADTTTVEKKASPTASEDTKSSPSASEKENVKLVPIPMKEPPPPPAKVEAGKAN